MSKQQKTKPCSGNPHSQSCHVPCNPSGRSGCRCRRQGYVQPPMGWTGGDQPSGLHVIRRMVEVFAQTRFRMSISVSEFCHSPRIVSCSNSAMAGLMDRICDRLRRTSAAWQAPVPQIDCQEVVREGLRDGINIFDSRPVFSQSNIDGGSAQMSRNVLGIDLERLVEKHAWRLLGHPECGASHL